MSSLIHKLTLTSIIVVSESEMPNMQSSETWYDEGLLVSQITSDGEPRYGGADGGYPTNNSATTTLEDDYDRLCCDF
jgi:hypothetical protein